MAEVTWSDERLVAAARSGDVESIAVLVSGAHPHVQRFARSLCATPEDAEDAAQEALIVLYRKIGTLRASGALVSWVFRIIRNECIRRARLMVRFQPPLAEPTVVPSAEEEVFERLEAARVAAAIAALPADQRRGADHARCAGAQRADGRRRAGAQYGGDEVAVASRPYGGAAHLVRSHSRGA